jgi:L-serine/L-threonine ammonia-lyase
MKEPSLYIQTPVYTNPEIDAALGKTVYFKMECYQPVGSFKARGIGALCREAAVSGKGRLISSSGGNAGYAAAYAGRQLGVDVTVVVPESTSEMARRRIESEGAELIVRGAAWDEANVYAQRLAQEVNGAFIPPFDHPTIWQGNATLVDEAARQCPKPDAVVLSVGGGGLLCGVVEGLHRNGWADVPVIAVETEGAGWRPGRSNGRGSARSCPTSSPTPMQCAPVCGSPTGSGWLWNRPAGPRSRCFLTPTARC